MNVDDVTVDNLKDATRFCEEWFTLISLTRRSAKTPVPVMWGLVYPTRTGTQFDLLPCGCDGPDGEPVQDWGEMDRSLMYTVMSNLMELTGSPKFSGGVLGLIAPPTLAVHVQEGWEVQTTDMNRMWALGEWRRQGNSLETFPGRRSIVMMTGFHPHGAFYIRGVCSESEGDWSVRYAPTLNGPVSLGQDCMAASVHESLKKAHKEHPFGLLDDGLSPLS